MVISEADIRRCLGCGVWLFGYAKRCYCAVCIRDTPKMCSIPSGAFTV